MRTKERIKANIQKEFFEKYNWTKDQFLLGPHIGAVVDMLIDKLTELEYRLECLENKESSEPGDFDISYRIGL